MKKIALIDDAGVIARILKHMGLWREGDLVLTGGERSPPGEGTAPPVAESAAEEWDVGVVDYEHYYSDAIPNYDICEPA